MQRQQRWRKVDTGKIYSGGGAHWGLAIDSVEMGERKR